MRRDHGDRAALKAMVERWLREHRDPRDPLTTPVELLLEMFLVATSWRAAVGRMAAILLAAALIWSAMAIHGRARLGTVRVRIDEANAMQQWVDAGEASRLMRCEGEGLAFVGGRCHATGAGGWLIPLEAQQRLGQETAVGDGVEHGTTANPFGSR